MAGSVRPRSHGTLVTTTKWQVHAEVLCASVASETLCESQFACSGNKLPKQIDFDRTQRTPDSEFPEGHAVVFKLAKWLPGGAQGLTVQTIKKDPKEVCAHTFAARIRPRDLTCLVSPQALGKIDKKLLTEISDAPATDDSDFGTLDNYGPFMEEFGLRTAVTAAAPAN